jgi:hypothetical protein
MTLRQTWRAVHSGDWVLEPEGEIKAPSKFQKERITKAVTAARVYLEGSVKAKQIAKTLGVTDERAAQVLRLGIKTLRDLGWLRPAPAKDVAPGAKSA